MFNKSWLWIALLVVTSFVISNCASVGTARLPNKSQLFVSTSPEDGFILAGNLDYPYQPLGYFAVDSMQFTPMAMCSENYLAIGYGALEKVLNKEVKQKAKSEMGADGLIGLDYLFTPGIFTYVRVRGIAVKRK